MAVFRPFKAVRPKREYAARVAALPYDVMSSGEAREMVKDDPYSFLHIDRPEVDLDPSVNIYDPAVYKKAGENLKGLLTAGINVREEKPVYYIYRQIMDGRAQAGIVGCASIDDYENNIIKKHELTREDKEEDRVRHVDACNANTGPIFLTFRDDGRVTEFINSWMGNHDALFDFTADDGIRHTVWTIDDAEVIGSVERYFGAVPSFYIADGHHRCASAYRVGKMRRAAKPDYDGTEEFNFFLSVLFPANELKIMDYNRVVKDLKGLTAGEFLEKVSGKFTVEELPENADHHPAGKHTVNCFVEGKWYALTAKKGSFDENDPVAQLDVSILQDNLLGPVLGIDDPRTDERIRFIGGIRGLGELERLVNEGGGAAFAMYPTTLDDLMTIADTGLIMPPKSTWFEPKLRSGLFIHELS
ncbi:MAG: DUF1015 domain-containing protein [Lachnospiraceae bacterium]|nr:DUF1015 domain-containing protein [Lachnospiraceae bacterium]